MNQPGALATGASNPIAPAPSSFLISERGAMISLKRWLRALGSWLYRLISKHEAMISLKLPDNSIKQVPAGTRPREIAEGIGKRLAQAAVAAKLDGTIIDLDWE